jgi:ADP-ribose pyrophosphatase YjhB (NUDIX family)
MTIKSQFDHRGKTYKVEYTDGAPVNANPIERDAVHAYCFYGNRLVIVNNGPETGWTPPGGTVEKGETFEEAAIREVQEESNMKVTHMEWIGFQEVEIPGENRTVCQGRMFCIVEPLGDFESDPDGDIQEMKLIDSTEYKKYILWGEIGDHVMKRALEMKKDFDSRNST